MQQTKSYWRVVAVAGVVGAFVASACVVTTSTDAGSGGTAGTSSPGAGTGGSSTAGTASTSGGSSGTFGIAGTNSVAGSGGAAITPFKCDTDGKATGTKASCAATAGNMCSTCTEAHCCTEFSDCYATNPGNICGYGGPNGDGQGEILCIIACLQAVTGDGGVADDGVVGTCANSCITPKDSTGAKCPGSVIGQQTSDLVACLRSNCSTECIGG